MRRSSALATVSALALVALSAEARAVVRVTLETSPPEPVAGQPFRLVYTLQVQNVPSNPGLAAFALGTDITLSGGAPLPQDLAVIGLPGCARSPKLNGFDWVLWRLMADVPVTRTDIMTLGAGGLLKEIPSRPQLRDPEAAGDDSESDGPQRMPRIAAVVIALNTVLLVLTFGGA